MPAKRDAVGRRWIELETTPFDNSLAKNRRRLLLIVPWVTPGGADKFNIDLVAQLTRRGWEITVLTTLYGDHSWLPRIERLTPDVFALPHLVKPTDYPRFIRYIVASRAPDVILISNSLFAYTALPYLRRIAGHIPIVDYCHSEIESWLGGGYPRLSVDNQGALDLQITASAHLREWMVKRSGDPARIEVCYINVEQNGARKSRSDLGLPEETAILLYPCRITVEKQPWVFAKSVLELRHRDYRFCALVVGDGPYLKWLKRFVKRHRLHDCVRFLGQQSNTRVRELMSRRLRLPSLKGRRDLGRLLRVTGRRRRGGGSRHRRAA